jgi:hypothetical protein
MQLRAVVDAIVAADSRYQWRENDSVIVFRPVTSWLDGSEVLDLAIPSLKREDMQAVDALIVLARLFGVNPTSLSSPADTKHFSLDLPPGRIFDALNGIVRAHGTLAWTWERVNRRESEVIVSLIAGASGAGFGIPRGAARRGLSGVPMTSRQRLGSNAQASLLDRIVGTRRDGQPLILRGLSGLPQLADAVGVPMAVELLPPNLRRPGPELPAVAVTGAPLGYVLSTLSALDPRYQWREMDGVIVFRPVDAWTDAYDPLFRLVENVRLDDVQLSESVSVVLSLLDSTHRDVSFPDTRRVAVNLPQGSLLELLNMIARSHGEVCWQWEELAAAERRSADGRRYSVMFTLFGGRGVAFAVP